VDFAVERAIQRAQQSVTEAYLRAESAGAVLLACALADEDEFGFFDADAVAARLEGGAGVGLDAELERLATELGVLQARDAAEGRRYRFVNALLPPYVVMRGLADGTVQSRDLP
ncbi:MAG: hypothetical protein ACXWZP_07345, partial [Gaiellaceae bacterium]